MGTKSKQHLIYRTGTDR